MVHDNATEILIYGNLYANNLERNPLCKGGSTTAIVNNYIYNPGRTVFHYALNGNVWKGHEWVTGKMAVEGNYIQYGPNTADYIAPALFMGPVEVYWKDNKILKSTNLNKEPAREYKPRPKGLLISEMNILEKPSVWPQGLISLPVDQVKDHVLENAGAFPWDRDSPDRKIIDGVISGKGKIIDSEKEAGGYPVIKPVYRKWNGKY